MIIAADIRDQIALCTGHATRGLGRNSRGQWHAPSRDADARALKSTESDETGRVGIRSRDGLS